MRISWIVDALLIVVGAACANGAETGSISGVIRDGERKPVEGATVAITCDRDRSQKARTTSDKEGAYRFAGLRLEEYQVAVQRTGFVSPEPRMVRISPATASAAIDFTLTQRPPGQTPSLGSAPRFEAAGVRGLIDPGGYSAPANAAAASGLIEGIADMSRADRGPGASAEILPCALEPALRKAVDLAPDSAEANRRLGQFYLAHDRPARAIPFFERARPIGADHYEASRDLANAWIRNGQFDSARTLLSALAAHRSEPEIHALLARAEEGRGMFVQAAQEYRMAANTEPSEENLFGVGYELVLSGSAEDAGKAFRAGMERYPRSIRLLIGVGTAEFLSGRSSQAVLSLLRAADLSPSDPRPYSFLVKAFTIGGTETERVRASLKRFVELAPESAQANYLYALTLLHGHTERPDSDESTVETLLTRAIGLDPNLADARFQLAARCAERGDYECAVRNYEATVRLSPGQAEAHYRLAMAYKQAGKEALAAGELELFQKIRARKKTGMGSAETSIAQFISVLNRPGHSGSAAPPCPGWER